MQQYFAIKPTEEIGKDLISKIDDYNKYLQSSGILSELRDSYRYFYGNSAIESTGVNGELSKIHVNNYASLIRGIHTMVTSQRPAFECRASNTDHKSQSQTILAGGVLDYYMREKRLERLLKEATELALFLREGWVSTTWNVTGGETYGINPETNLPIFEGDINYNVHKINDVIRDFRKKDSHNFNWLIIREWKNKFDLAAKYPELAEKIVNITTKVEIENQFSLTVSSDDKGESEEIPFYTFYHKKTESLPNGRMVEFLDHDLILFDGVLPYRKVPLYRISSANMIETAFGHSPAFDLLPLQDALNMTFSTVLTNQKSFGVQSIWSKKGNGLSVTQISGGLNLIESEVKPEPLNLTQTPPEIFNFINIINQFQESLSGQNAVARGNASPQLSGAAMALLQSTALQFSSGVQQSYSELLEDVGTGSIHLLADFAATPRIAYIIGKHNRSLIKQFKGEDVDQISRVTVDSANALTKTTAGRVEIANQLLQAGMIKRPEQYIMVIQTGQLEPLLESDTSQLLRIKAENELLAEGKQVSAIISDDHQLDVREHLSVLDSPEARQNEQVVSIVLAHVQQHIELYKSMPPELMQILGRQPIAQPQAPQGMPQVMDATMPVTQQAEAVNQPNFPVDPMSGQRTNASGPTNY